MGTCGKILRDFSTWDSCLRNSLPARVGGASQPPPGRLSLPFFASPLSARISPSIVARLGMQDPRSEHMDALFVAYRIYHALKVGHRGVVFDCLRAL